MAKIVRTTEFAKERTDSLAKIGEMKIGWSVFRESPILKIGTFANTLIIADFGEKREEGILSLHPSG